MKQTTKIVAFVVAASILLNGNISVAKSSKRTTIKQKRITMEVGYTKKIQLKNKRKEAKYTYQSSRAKIVKVSKKGLMTAKKKGKAKITVKQKTGKKVTKIGTITITVIPKQKSTSQTPSNQSQQGNTTPMPQTSSPSSTPSAPPTATPTPVPTPTPKPPVGPAGFEVPGDFDSKQDSVTYGTVEKKQYYSTTTETTRKVNIILPASYTADKQYPVLYLLHGIGGDENEWLNQGKPNYILSNLAAKGLAKEMIVVIPNCRARANDAATNEFSLEHYAAFDNFINDLRDNLMPYIEENYSIATGRENTAIAGLSMGGRESLNIGLHMPETFGYIAAFSPGYGVFAYTANGVSEEGLFTEETFRLPDAYKDNTLLLINNGISEGGENAIGGTCHKVLEKNDIPHLFYVTTGGHDFRVWKHGLYNFAIRIFQ